MFNNTALEVVIGLIFIFLLYSLLATILAEICATLFAFRASNLETAISRMLNDSPEKPDKFLSRMFDTLGIYFKRIGRLFRVKPKGASKDFYTHTYVKYLGENNTNPHPSYISPGTFSWVMIQLLKEKAKQALDPEDSALPDPQKFKKFLDEKAGWLGPETRKQMLAILEESEYDLIKFRQKMERWFNETMERATEWYKRKMQYVLFSIGLGIAMMFNASTIEIVKRLSHDDEARTQLVALAQNAEQIKGYASLDLTDSLDLNNKLDTLLSVRKMLNDDIQDAHSLMALGWDECAGKGVWCFFGGLFGLKKIVGFILTALAISLGAPFWFDILNKLIRVRAAVQPKSDEKN